MSRTADYSPVWASPPGETIGELARKRGVSDASLASALGVSEGDMPCILDGRWPITAMRAERLETILGGSKRFWLARETQYRQSLQFIEEEARGWLSNLPVADMRKFGWIGTATGATERLMHALSFFGVRTVDEWRDAWLSERAGLTAYRTSPVFEAQAASVAAWLRQGELIASRLPTTAWSREKFERLLPDLKPLTRLREPADFVPQLQRFCASCGVAVAIVRAPKGCPASGATRFRNGQAILQLSVRYLRDDSFWFTFFHEAAHLVLHEDRLFLEWSEKGGMEVEEELEANEYAGRLLIPPESEARLRSLPHGNYKSIMRFARDLSISPGLVVGQLQHRKLIAQDRLNYLKKRYLWSTER